MMKDPWTLHVCGSFGHILSTCVNNECQYVSSTMIIFFVYNCYFKRKNNVKCLFILFLTSSALKVFFYVFFLPFFYFLNLHI